MLSWRLIPGVRIHDPSTATWFLNPLFYHQAQIKFFGIRVNRGVLLNRRGNTDSQVSPLQSNLSNNNVMQKEIHDFSRVSDTEPEINLAQSS